MQDCWFNPANPNYAGVTFAEYRSRKKPLNGMGRQSPNQYSYNHNKPRGPYIPRNAAQAPNIQQSVAKQQQPQQQANAAVVQGAGDESQRPNNGYVP